MIRQYSYKGYLIGTVLTCALISALLAMKSGVVESAVAPTPQATPTPVVFPDANVEFVIGPQVKTGNSWFDTNELSRATVHGNAIPATPPVPLTDAYILNQYYDMGLTEYIAYYRSGDAAYLTQARKVADSWWQSSWINSGAVRNLDEAGPPPRHAGIGGLILRALDGRPEMWDWINVYTRFHFDLWLKRRISDPQLYYGVREGAFALHGAIWLAKTLPDSFPLQAGGTASNGAALRAAYLADCESQVLNYFARLQYPDGSWRWNTSVDEFVDNDGGTLVGITQPFMIGLLLNALIDVDRLTANAAVRASIRTQLTKACTQLFNGGPYRRTEETGISGLKWRSFWYFYYGGTSVNPTRYANGGGSYAAPAQSWMVKSERQGISTLFSAYAYTWLITGEAQYLAMGQELVDAAFVGTDGVRNEADGTAKNYNQNYRMGGRYFAWIVGASPTPSPSPTPTVSITGSVTVSGTALPQVTVNLLRSTDRAQLGQSITGGAGTYSLSPAFGSSVIVQPVRTGYSFTPTEVLISSVTTNQVRNFAAVAPTPTPTPTPTPSPTPTSSPTPDPTRPVVAISSPLNGATVSGTISVTATATDNVGVTITYLIVDGLVVGADEVLPYTFNLNTTGYSNGSHSMFVRAWDAAGNAGDSAVVTVTVSNGGPTPTPTPTPSPTPTPTPTPSPSPTPTPRPFCEPNQLQITGCRCTTRWYRNPKRCKP